MSALGQIGSSARELVEFYSVHIEKEERHFFKPCLEYFTDADHGLSRKAAPLPGRRQCEADLSLTVVLKEVHAEISDQVPDSISRMPNWYHVPGESNSTGDRLPMKTAASSRRSGCQV